MSTNARLGAWQEVIQVFLQYAADDPDAPSIRHLVMALGRFFPSCRLIALSYTTQGPLGRPFWEGARWDGEEASLLEQEDAETQAKLFGSLDQKNDFSGHTLRSTNTFPNLPWLLLLDEKQYSSSDGESKIGIVILDVGHGLWEELADRFVWLRLYFEGLPALATAFRAVSRAQEARLAWKLARISDLRNAVANFVHSGSDSADLQLYLSLQVEEKLNASLAVSSEREHLVLAKELADATLQKLLGDGRDLRRIADDVRVATSTLSPFLKALRNLENWQPTTSEDEVLRQSLLWLNLSLQAAITGAAQDLPPITNAASSELPDEARQSIAELAQLAFWSSLHQEALSNLLDDELAISDNEWKERQPGIKAAVTDLQMILKSRFKHKRGEGLRVKLLPTWFRLWFCCQLACEACGLEKLGAWGRWQLWAYLAYVIREAMRALVYGRRADYRFQTTELVVALRTVVEHHAIYVLGLPSDPDIRALLHEVSQVNSINLSHFAPGHLQHALETYMAGQFFCEAEIEIDSRSWTIQEVLASRSSWQPGPLSCVELRKAFGLAALFHDVGRLLLPRPPQPATRWGQVDRILLRELAQVHTGLLDTVSRLTENCAAELRKEGYFDLHLEPAIESWIAERQERKEVDPALVSAWFLHRICQNVQGLQSSTVQQAVRAVLLHRLASQPIHVDVDPAAALLVACDQILTWNVAPRRLAPGDAGHSIQVLAPAVNPSASPFRRLELYSGSQQSPRLELKYSHGRLRGDFGEGHRATSMQDWPHFVLELREPEALDTPVYWIWLSMAQNLGRMVRSRKHGWAPVVTIHSGLKKGQMTTLDLLRRVADRSSLRPALERWLDSVAGKYRSEEGQFEEITLSPLNRLLHREDICYIFPELDALAKEIRSRARSRG